MPNSINKIIDAIFESSELINNPNSKAQTKRGKKPVDICEVIDNIIEYKVALYDKLRDIILADLA